LPADTDAEAKRRLDDVGVIGESRLASNPDFDFTAVDDLFACLPSQ
jgi:hypothetical protein